MVDIDCILNIFKGNFTKYNKHNNMTLGKNIYFGGSPGWKVIDFFCEVALLVKRERHWFIGCQLWIPQQAWSHWSPRWEGIDDVFHSRSDDVTDVFPTWTFLIKLSLLLKNMFWCCKLSSCSSNQLRSAALMSCQSTVSDVWVWVLVHFWVNCQQWSSCWGVCRQVVYLCHRCAAQLPWCSPASGPHT